MRFIVHHLNSIDVRCLVYADDIVIFSQNQVIDLAIYSLNNILSSLHNILSINFFDITHEKCKFLIFFRRCIQQCPHTPVIGHILPFVSNYTYLGMILDPKLRWGPQITYLTKITSRWANIL
uniref:Reverse transcriptase domain-containing protein n=1 Tax=Sipha flava TaxID=143950 RepID=A0A2S2RAK9_9HEMI